MKLVIVGIDHGNIGSQAMLDVVRLNSRGTSYAISHVSPEALGLDDTGIDCGGVIHLRSYVAALVTPHQLWRFVMPVRQRTLLELFREAEVLYDISGFALSSEFRIFSTLRYLAPIMLAARYGARIVLLPQSFGPFDYRLRQLAIPVIRWVLSRAQCIFARDEASVRYMRSIGIDARHGHDLVYLYERREDSNVALPCDRPSVGVVPNVHLTDIVSESQLIERYVEVIRGLVSRGLTPVMFAHNQGGARKSDQALLWKVVQALPHDITSDDYVFITENVNGPTVNSLYSKLKFIIGSRFHSLVLNYANGKPAVLIGWAEKYNGLASDFHQSDYVVDIRSDDAARVVLEAVDTLMSKYDKEVDTITRRLGEIRTAACAGLAPFLPGLRELTIPLATNCTVTEPVDQPQALTRVEKTCAST